VVSVLASGPNGSGFKPDRVLPAETTGENKRNELKSENFAYSVSEITPGIFNVP
jgi:hypothetical protein